MTSPSRGIRVARAGLIGLGALLLGVAGGALVAGVPAGQWGAILLWLAGAVVLHDAVFAPLVLVGTRLLRRVGARVSWAPIAVVQVAMVIGAALTLVAFPGIQAQRIGARNPSVLVFPYALHLALAWAAIGVLTAAVVLVLAVRRRRRARRGLEQDRTA
ncbi:hypothetical protein [uncultured Amnibacterium sp.]|uniref:hypothetical protein n=1 Tax=uncultured Amnibacterium sp. TaxID=1631851 RepID=UPI0035C9BA3B